MAVTHDDNLAPDAALIREAAALLDAIRAEPVPPAITELAQRLQDRLDVIRAPTRAIAELPQD